MKTTRLDLPVMASWMESNQRRLDGKPYLSGAFEAKVILERLPKENLRHLWEVTQGGLKGIFNGPRFARSYVDDPDYGVPFLGSTDILAADFSNLAMISKKQVKAHPELLIDEGWTLITCSGTIGRMAYSRADMKGMAGSQHFMRVVPDRTKIPPGYLYAYLSSKFGVPLVVSGTYGAIIQHIEAHHVADLPVPRLGDEIEAEAHSLVIKAASNRVQSKELLDRCQAILHSTLGTPPVASPGEWRGTKVSSLYLREFSRFDAFFHNPSALLAEEFIKNSPGGFATLDEMTEEIFDVPPFKHIYVEPGSGLPFFTSGEIFLLDRKTDKYLSRTQTKALSKYIIKQGWILLARSGQIGGIIGRPQYTDSALHNAATSDHVIRIVPKVGTTTAGFLFTLLASPNIGYALLTRTMSGSSIPALWPKYLKQMKVPIVAMTIQEQLDELVNQAFELRVQATSYENQARNLIETTIEKAAAAGL